MTKQLEAMKQALGALESAEMSNYGRDWVWPDTAHPTAMAMVKQAITALRQAIEQAQKQEPVAWMDGYRNIYSLEEKAAGCEEAVIPLYPSPPQRKPLTDEEIAHATAPVLMGGNPSLTGIARAIEAAHGITGEQK